MGCTPAMVWIKTPYRPGYEYVRLFYACFSRAYMPIREQKVPGLFVFYIRATHRERLAH